MGVVQKRRVPHEKSIGLKLDPSYLDSHVTRFSTVLHHSVRFQSPKDQSGATVEIELRDCQDMGGGV